MAVAEDEADGVVILLPPLPPPLPPATFPLEDPYELEGLKLVLGIAGLFAGFVTTDDDDDEADTDDELDDVPELFKELLLQLDADGALVDGAEPKLGAGIFWPSHGTAKNNKGKLFLI